MIIVGSLGTALAITSIILQPRLPIRLQLFCNLLQKSQICLRNPKFCSAMCLTISSRPDHKMSRYIRLHCHYKFQGNSLFQFPGRRPASRLLLTARTRSLSPGWLPSSLTARWSTTTSTCGRWSTAGRRASGASRCLAVSGPTE